MSLTNGRWHEAEWRGPIPNMTHGGMYAHKGVVLHIMEGTLAGTDSWFKNPKAQASAHFGIGKDGTVYQWVDCNDKAWAEVMGNGFWISVENEGKSGEPLTDAQIESNAKLFAWVHRAYGAPLQKASEPAGNGLGYHAMGGSDWGGHLQCPGHLIVAQRQKILDRAHDLLNNHTEPRVPIEHHGFGNKPVLPPKKKPAKKPAPKRSEPAWYDRELKVDKPMLHGDDVKKVQRLVGATEDGWFGPNTEARVRGWQRAHKLSPDGIVGPKTATAMGA